MDQAGAPALRAKPQAAAASIGTRAATNKYWAGSCDVFRYYEELLGAAAGGGAAAPG